MFRPSGHSTFDILRRLSAERHQASAMFSVTSARAALPRLLLLLLCTNGFVVSAQSATKEDIQQLRKLLAAQQEQINDLRRLLNEQSKLQVTQVSSVDRPPRSEHVPEATNLPSRPSRSLARVKSPPHGRRASNTKPADQLSPPISVP